MHIQYGNIHLNLVSINELTRQAVFLGPNYVFSRWKMSVRCWLNPMTQGDLPSLVAPSTHPPANGPLVTVATQTNVPPVLSEAALRHDLMQTRGQLVFSFLGRNSVVCPLPGFPCDCDGGPKPESVSVQQISPKTWVIDWTVSFALNEAFQYPSYTGKPLVLAQAFSLKHVLDEDFFTARVLEGQVLFDLGALQALTLTPDDYRNVLIALPPIGWKREKVDVESDPEQPGLLKYRVLDRQIPFGWYNAGITRLEAHHRIRTTKKKLTDVILEHGPKILKSGTHLLRNGAIGLGAIAATGGVAIVPTIAAMLPSLGEAGLDTAKATLDALPVSYHQVEVVAHGSPTSTRADMENFARQVVSARLSSFFVSALPSVLAGIGVRAVQAGGALLFATPFASALIGAINAANRATTGVAGAIISNVTSPLASAASGAAAIIVPYGVDTEVDHLISGKGIRLTYTAITGPIGTIFSGASAVLNLSPMPNMEETFLGEQPLISTQVTPPLPPSSNATRGNWLSDVVTEALAAPNRLPPDLPAGNAPLPREGFPLTL